MLPFLLVLMHFSLFLFISLFEYNCIYAFLKYYLIIYQSLHEPIISLYHTSWAFLLLVLFIISYIYLPISWPIHPFNIGLFFFCTIHHFILYLFIPQNFHTSIYLSIKPSINYYFNKFIN